VKCPFVTGGVALAGRLSEVLRGIIVQEQEHLMDLADALGIEAPEID
jgi:hypothetical protein